MRILLIRIGAYGDCIIITPLIRYLKQQGNEVYVMTSKAGKEVLRCNPNIDKLIYYEKDSVPNDKLGEHFQKVADDNKCDKLIDLCGSIESTLALTPLQPQYNWSKQERIELCNKNYYEHTLSYYDKNIEYIPEICNPEVFFTEKEQEEMAKFRGNYLGKKVVLIGLSGSSASKAYPYLTHTLSIVLEFNPNVVFITTGDDKCEILEVGLDHPNIINKSNKWSFRQSMLMCKYADLVLAPDTGLIHASGCFNTPKICLLGQTSKENITKHFINDYSIESNVTCSPCYRIIYSMHNQCPIENEYNSCFCMGLGIDPIELSKRILTITGVHRGKMSDLRKKFGSMLQCGNSR